MSFPTMLVHFYIEKGEKYYCFISVAWNDLEPSTTWSSPRYEYCLDPLNISMTYYCLGNNQMHDGNPELSMVIPENFCLSCICFDIN